MNGRAALRSVSTMSGGRLLTTTGTAAMLRSLVANWDLLLTVSDISF